MPKQDQPRTSREKPRSEIVAGPSYYRNGKLTWDWLFVYWHERPRIDLQFKWFDLWIGAYFDVPNRTWYICPVPMFVIKIYPKVSR